MKDEVLLALFELLVLSWLWAFMLAVVWGWVMVGTFNLPPLTYWECLGLILVWRMIK